MTIRVFEEIPLPDPRFFCGCGGRLLNLDYVYEGRYFTNEVIARNEERSRRLKVCQNCSRVYAIQEES